MDPGPGSTAPPPFVRVAPALFLGSARAAASSELLARAGITLCVNVSRQQPGPRAPGVGELRVPVFDDPAEDLLAHLEPSCAAMEAAVRAGGACLVYCKNGRSRSASVCTAYLMRHRGLDLARAFQVRPPTDRLRGGASSGRAEPRDPVGAELGGGQRFRRGRGSTPTGLSGRGGALSGRVSKWAGLRGSDVVAGRSYAGAGPRGLYVGGGAGRGGAVTGVSPQTVRSARPVAEPNPGFWSQLQRYEAVLRARGVLAAESPEDEP